MEDDSVAAVDLLKYKKGGIMKNECPLVTYKNIVEILNV